MAAKRPTGLGRGLSALMADVVPGDAKDAGSVSPQPDQIVPIDQIHPNPGQPRRSFKQSELDDLAASIREKGVIQPLILRPSPTKAGEYEIVAGERRWRASQLARLHEVPALIRDYDDTEALEIAIIENIQRADLNPLEEAAGYRDLMERFGHTQEKLGDALGKSRSHIANLLRLLNLPEGIQALVREEKLSAGHARALLTAEDPEALAQQIVAKGLSVRETERLAKKKTGETSATAAEKPQKDADTRQLEQDLSAALGMKVSINHKQGSQTGQVVVRYQNFDELDEICRRLNAVLSPKE